MSARSEEILKMIKALDESEIRAIVGKASQWLENKHPAMPLEEAIEFMNTKPIPGPHVSYSRDEMNER